MQRPAAPPPPPPSPAKGSVRSPRTIIPARVPLITTNGVLPTPTRNFVYGTGGVGKSTLAAWMAAPYFIDLERGTSRIPVSRDSTVTTWLELRGKLAELAHATPKGVRSVVVDSATEAQELANQHVIETRLTEKGKEVDSIEGYGWGKGWQFTYDEFNGLLADLDRLVAKGLSVCLTAHSIATEAPNPYGEAFLRWEPNLYAGDKRGRSSIRERVKNWADNMLFMSFDVFVEEGRGQGSGTRTVYSGERPTHLAKSRDRDLALPFNLDDPQAIWRELGVVEPASTS